MQSSFYVSLSSQIAIDKRMTAVATNIANAGTIGYRVNGVDFETILSKSGTTPTAYVSLASDFLSRAQGEMTKTGNPLDVAVSGEGWLAIQTPNGTAYTRDGRLQVLETGELQTILGYPVLDAGGSPITLDPQGGPPMPGGPVGANFNALLRVEVGNGRVELMGVPPGAAISEPAHVPSSEPGHEGWLLSVVDIPNHPDPSQQRPGDYSSELWIINAGNVAAGPVAKVRTGLALRSQVHGAWVSRERLDHSVRKG